MSQAVPRIHQTITTAQLAEIISASPKTLALYARQVEAKHFPLPRNGNHLEWPLPLAYCVILATYLTKTGQTFDSAYQLVLESLANRSPLPSYPEGYGPKEWLDSIQQRCKLNPKPPANPAVQPTASATPQTPNVEPAQQIPTKPGVTQPRQRALGSSSPARSNPAPTKPADLEQLRSDLTAAIAQSEALKAELIETKTAYAAALEDLHLRVERMEEQQAATNEILAACMALPEQMAKLASSHNALLDALEAERAVFQQELSVMRSIAGYTQRHVDRYHKTLKLLKDRKII